MTSVRKINLILGFNSVVDETCLFNIRRDGKSRIPICLNGEKNKIVAFLLTKSLIGVDPAQKKTIEELYQEKRINIRVPLFMHRESILGKMVKVFQTSHTHMAVVLQTAEAAQEMRDYADDYLRKLTASKTLSVNDSQVDRKTPLLQDQGRSIPDGDREVVGIVTLENIIERILLQDILDEND